MRRQWWWMGLLGSSLALLGVWGAWVPHRAAALVLSAWDLAEFVKFVPGVSATRELFYLPVWCVALVLGVIANQPTNRPATRLGLGAVALGLTVAILPPYPDVLNGYGSPEFRWRFILGVSGALAVLLSLSSGRWPARAIGGWLVVLALAGAVPALWQFLHIRDAIESVYGASLGWGWGLAVFLAGWALIGLSGGRLLLSIERDNPGSKV